MNLLMRSRKSKLYGVIGVIVALGFSGGLFFWPLSNWHLPININVDLGHRIGAESIDVYAMTQLSDALNRYPFANQVTIYWRYKEKPNDDDFVVVYNRGDRTLTYFNDMLRERTIADDETTWWQVPEKAIHNIANNKGTQNDLGRYGAYFGNKA